MTVTGDPAHPAGHQATPSPIRLEPGVATASLNAICPYLAAGDGTWQSASPIRDQRCGAVDPPALLARDKQRDLCLVSAHRGCATFVAAQASAATLGSRIRGRTTRTCGPSTRSKVLVVETERRLPGLSGSPVRAGGQVALVALMVVAFVVLLVARTSPTGSRRVPGGVARCRRVRRPGSRSRRPPHGPPRRRAHRHAASPTAEADRHAQAHAEADREARHRRYTVKSGDTLGAIALRFGTTLKVLKRLNEITDPRRIHPGQVLVLP